MATRRQEDDLKLEALRAEVAAGIAAIDRGEFTDVEKPTSGTT